MKALTRRFTPNHPAVCPCLKSRLLWAEMNPISYGGVQCSPRWFAARYGLPNASQTLSLIATDFQFKS